MMERYRYDEINIGYDASFEVTITEKMQNSFRELSGDINPLHMDNEFALKRGFKDKVVFGMLTSSLYSKLVGVYLPGENCLIHSVEVKFIKPVYIGDSVIVYGKVAEKNNTFKILTIKAEIKNSMGVKVSKAIIKVGVLDE